MSTITRDTTQSTTPFQHDPNYLTLSRMLARYQNLILLTPIPNEALEQKLAPWQKTIQDELWSPLPFHRTKWLRSIEGARTLLLKLEQDARNIKVQRTKKEVVRDLAEKRMIIKRLRSRVEEIGREVESGSSNRNGYAQSQPSEEIEGESMYEVLQQLRASKRQKTVQNDESGSEETREGTVDTSTTLGTEDTQREQLFSSKETVRRRQGKSATGAEDTEDAMAKTSGFSNLRETEQSLLDTSREHENITTSLVSMAAQLKQQARQFQFTLEQDKGLVDRALEGLDQNMAAMGIASKGMKTLQRMSEEQGFWGRLKLQLLIAGMWLFVILLVFVGPKLRF